MKIFVLRRGDTQPIGPLTAAEVAEMRIRWQLSDADYYRADGAGRWKLIGDLAPASARSQKRHALRSAVGLASLALVGVLAILLASRPHPSAQPDNPAALAAGVVTDIEQPLPENSDIDLSPTSPEPSAIPLSDPTIEGNI